MEHKKLIEISMYKFITLLQYVLRFSLKVLLLIRLLTRIFSTYCKNVMNLKTVISIFTASYVLIILPLSVVTCIEAENDPRVSKHVALINTKT